MTDTAPTTDTVVWQRLGRVTAVAGVATLVVFFASVVGTRDEPPFTAAANEFLAYYRSPDTVATPLRGFLFSLWLVAFVCFVGALTTMLRRAEGQAPWRSTIAMGCGVVFVALGLSGAGNEAAVTLRADDLDPQIARYAFDQGQAAFANARVALGCFAGCCGWVILSTRFLPRWVGWLAIASGVGLVITRISWTNMIWLVPYLMLWVWVLVVAALLLRPTAVTSLQRDTRPSVGDPHGDTNVSRRGGVRPRPDTRAVAGLAPCGSRVAAGHRVATPWAPLTRAVTVRLEPTIGRGCHHGPVRRAAKPGRHLVWPPLPMSTFTRGQGCTPAALRAPPCRGPHRRGRASRCRRRSKTRP